MKNILLLALNLVFINCKPQSQEITLYDQTGHPLIYLSPENDNSFYTWDGHAVAYLYDSELIYGWKGKHIGWYINGVIYDLQGYRVGSISEKCPTSVYSESSKYSKYSQYSRYSRYSPYSRPSLKSSYSDVKLINFITQNKAGQY